jgi:hypothetical protein
VSCPEGETATSGLCVKNSKDGVDASSGDKLEGVLANNGTPFYIMAIIVVMLGGLGFAVHGTKKMAPGVLLLSEATHLLLFMLNSAGLMSEIVLATAVLSSGDQPLLPFGIMLLLSRMVVGVTPGLTVCASIFSGKDVPLVDETTGKKALKYFIDSDVIVANSKLYVFMLALSMFEPTLLALLPWYETEMSNVARFPTLEFMKQVYVFEVLQLVITLAAQIGITVLTQGDGGTAGILVIMNVVFSVITLFLKGCDMVLKWGLLRGASKNEDCEAAQEARKRVVQLERSVEEAGFSIDSVYSDARQHIYASNPMLQLVNVTASARPSQGDDTDCGTDGTEGEGEGEGGSLLSHFRTLQGRVEAVEGRQSLYESRLDSFARRDVSE